MHYRFIDRKNGELLCRISEDDFDVFFGNLEQEDPADSDYFIDADTIDMLIERGMPYFVEEKLKPALGEEGLDLGWEREIESPDYTVTGRIVARGEPQAGFCVRAYDEDNGSPDDFLGWAYTRPDGRFEIGFRNEDFKEYIGPIDIEGAPEVYLRIFDRDSKEVKHTPYRRQETESADWGDVSID